MSSDAHNAAVESSRGRRSAAFAAHGRRSSCAVHDRAALTRPSMRTALLRTKLLDIRVVDGQLREFAGSSGSSSGTRGAHCVEEPADDRSMLAQRWLRSMQSFGRQLARYTAHGHDEVHASRLRHLVIEVASTSTVRRIDLDERTRRACRLTNRWSGRVKDKVPSSNFGVRAAQLNR